MLDKDKTYHHGNLKEALIEAGLEILSQQGIAKLSLRNCAQAVGVSHTAPKNHFGSLAGLLTALATRGYDLLAQFMQRSIEPAMSRKARRQAALEGYVDFAIAHPNLYDLMFARERITLDDPELTAQVGHCFGILMDISQELDWSHHDKANNNTRAQLFLWSTVHGYAQLRISGRFKKDEMKALNIMDILPDL